MTRGIRTAGSTERTSRSARPRSADVIAGWPAPGDQPASDQGDSVQNLPHDAPSASKVRANEANVDESWRYVASQCGGEVSDEPDLVLFTTGIPIAFFNGVCGAKLSADNADDRIEFAKSWLRRRAVPFEWFAGPSSTPADLGTRLIAHGFVPGGEPPGMDVDLVTLVDVEPLPAGMSVERVRTKDQMSVWAETSLRGFQAPAHVVQPGIEVLSRLNHDDEEHLRCYLAFLDGQPVGTSLLFLGAGVAGLYSIATIREARQRGVGRALTLAPLSDARAMGYGVAVLQASSMGYPVYRRIGFEERFRYRAFSWPVE